MQTARLGDSVWVRYVKRTQDGSVVPARSRTPVEMTVGVDHPRLPGLVLKQANARGPEVSPGPGCFCAHHSGPAPSQAGCSDPVVTPS